jgi:hypothetical protein
MQAICRSYASHGEARASVDAVLGAGIPAGAVRVLSAQRERDARAQPMGGFAGTAGATVGSFAGVAHGAPGAFAGMAQRGGSFADADRDVLTDYPDGVERMRVTGHRKLVRLLTEAGLDEQAAARDVRALHAGRVLVLVDAVGADPARVGELLDA